MFYRSRSLFLPITLSCLLSTGCAVSLGVGVGSQDPEYLGEGETPRETSDRARLSLFEYFSKLVERKRAQPA